MAPNVTTADKSPGRMPVVYLSHGAPLLADDEEWTGQLARWSAELPGPSSVLVISAHWEEAPLTLGATETVPLVYDFWGFPRRYYDVTYPAPGAPQLAASVRAMLTSADYGVHQDLNRGLDHGAYVPLIEMFPAADVRTLQISLPTLDPAALVEVGRRLAPLRDEGVLIIGSGFTTHNLRLIDMGGASSSPAQSWSSEFDAWADGVIRARDFDALVDFEHRAPAAAVAHPRTEHFAPLFVSLGAVLDDFQRSDSVIDGFWYGLSKRSWQFA